MKAKIGWSKDTIELPQDVERIMRRAFPSYNGRKFRIMPQTYACMSDTYWDGGSRSQYVIVRLATGDQMAIPDLISGGFLPTASAAVEAFSSFILPDGIGVVRHSIFCGKDSGLTLIVRPDNLPPTLTA